MSNATYCTTARPPWAVTMWSDCNNVYVEIPTKSGPPYIMRFPTTEAGLSKALGIMRKAHDAAEAIYHYPTKQEVVTEAKSHAFTDGQRAETRNLLRKMGLIG